MSRFLQTMLRKGYSLMPAPLKRTYQWALLRFLRMFPIRDKVVFSNFRGRGLGDDPKYIALELHKRYPQLKLIWMVSSLQEKMPSWITPVKNRGLLAKYHYLTARVWILNVKEEIKPGKRPGQFYLQTWHAGVMGLKQSEKDVEDTLSEGYLRLTKQDSKDIDLMYADNDFLCRYFKTKFWYDGPVLKCDVPRVAGLLNPSEDTRQQVLQELGIAPNKKIVMYAPTFRKDLEVGSWLDWDYGKVVEAIKKRFAGDFVLLMRLHPDVADVGLSGRCVSDMVDVTAYPDMQRLLIATDVLISDYSSLMFEYGLLSKRPVFCIAKDLAEYASEDRHFLFEIADLPFPFALDDDELCRNIAEFREDEYCARIKKFTDFIGLDEHGNGPAMIADIVERKLKCGSSRKGKDGR